MTEQPPLFDEEPFRLGEEVQIQINGLKRSLDEIRQRNRALVQELHAEKVTLTEMAVLRTRVETLVSFIFGSASMLDTLEFELAFEQNISGLLSRAAEQARRAKLLAPAVPVPPDSGMPAAGLFIPGQ